MRKKSILTKGKGYQKRTEAMAAYQYLRHLSELSMYFFLDESSRKRLTDLSASHSDAIWFAGLRAKTMSGDLKTLRGVDEIMRQSAIVDLATADKLVMIADSIDRLNNALKNFNPLAKTPQTDIFQSYQGALKDLRSRGEHLLAVIDENGRCGKDFQQKLMSLVVYPHDYKFMQETVLLRRKISSQSIPSF